MPNVYMNSYVVHELEFLKELNPSQRTAVELTEGPVLVIAGPGSGKTRVLTYKVAYLIATKKASPMQIVALTFTNKAANEMKRRIVELIGVAGEAVFAGTFHAFAARVLRMFGDKVGIERNFTIYDEKDSQALIKDIIEELGYQHERVLTPSYVYERIERLKERFVTPEDTPIYEYPDREVRNIYREYNVRLQHNNALDFADLLFYAWRVLRESEVARERFSKKYILVDEYQDTNRAQYEILKVLAQKYRNITVVGDEDQSIYRWRGADIHNILDFEKDFPDAKVIRLEENYRSTKRILRVATHLISFNILRKGKQLYTTNPEGDRVKIIEAYDERDEARKVVDIVENAGRNLGDFAILYRTHFQSRTFEEELQRRGIPYVVVGGLRFYERKEVKDALAYLKVLVNPRDTVSLIRVIENPPKGIGKVTLKKLQQYAERHGNSLYGVLREVEAIPDIPARIKGHIITLYQNIERWRHLDVKPAELLDKILGESGYWEWIGDDEERIENLRELIASLREYEELEDYLRTVALFTDIDEWRSDRQKLNLMTLHSVKGLEFPIVILTGLEEGLFPHYKSLNEPEELEEERRLFYVGITRAKERVYITYAMSRRRRVCMRSRFLNELPSEEIDFEW